MVEQGRFVETQIEGTKVAIVFGDIVDQRVDAIVSAANERLKGGCGVDGAIHEAAGPKLSEACRAIGFCETGDAVVTPGFSLRTRYIIHTVGPVYAAGEVNELGKRHNEEAALLLASCYKKSLELAMANGARTIAFPAISTGEFEYPADRATDVAMQSVKTFLQKNPGAFDEIRFVMFDDDYFGIGHRKLKEHFDISSL
ncbi:MAG: hypothetical protein A2868_02350 [Candidatus Levybacteria bacterium RIFCSPHIGHO2_01_FULL_40_15b]|nr:MAG: hypothetical protein A2868_02350 [Candidatus Levybacteria bacterium RIFCSPHIGHO2_01_FULL_40_15b]